MPKKLSQAKNELPETLKHSDAKARRIWIKTHNNAVKTYGEGRRAHQVAYASLKHQYKKQGDRWVPKGWKGPSDPQAAQGYKNKPKPTAGGKVAKTEQEARAKAKESRKEYQLSRKTRG